MRLRIGAGTVGLALGLVSVAGAKVLPIFAEQCPCYWRGDGVEWTNHRERVQCATEVIRSAVDSGQITRREGARHARIARESPCGRRAFTRRYTCGGSGHRRCRGRNSCEVNDPQCTGTQLGYCISPGPCGRGGAPVCGCDGVTYANWCLLLDAGVALAHTGPCDAAPAVKASDGFAPRR